MLALLLLPLIQQGSAPYPLPGAFKPSWDSLRSYRCPDWYRDAKFGIWSVWGPQSVPKQGDWYARRIYQENDPDYAYHVAHYGHPSKFGYKDIIALWHAEKWDPRRLMSLYKKAGAKFFVVMANHHDNYDLWNSKYQPRWNSVSSGPHKDIVGIWRKEALANGLRFGVTEHAARSLNWMQPSHMSDTKGPLAGVPYDGANPEFQDLYHPPFPESGIGYSHHPTQAWINEWVNRTTDLLHTYKPDLFYFDGGVPFGEAGLKLVTDYYNTNTADHGGRNEAVLCVKNTIDGTFVDGTCLLDVERGAIKNISPEPWQSETCIGDWFYKEGIRYKTSGEVVRMLADIISKNGTLLLNAPLSPEGRLDKEAEKTLSGIGDWLRVNGEAVYGTRSYVVFGEGLHNSTGQMFQEDSGYTADDIRFTTKNGILYAFVLGLPTGSVMIKSPILGRVASIQLLSTNKPCSWRQGEGVLRIEPPHSGLNEIANVFRIRFLK
jgi:alpha-L-fucosidase